jgi:hypothetical protein
MGVILALFAAYVALVLIYSITSRPQETKAWRFAWLTLVGLIFLLSATRVGGSDWENYEYLYLYMSNADGWLDAIVRNPFFEPGYVALNYLFHLQSEDRRLLIVFESAINAYAIWLVLTRVKGGPILLIWLFPLQFANILGVRQTLATSLFIIATMLLQGRASVIASISSGLIHVSSILLIVGRSMKSIRLTWRTAAIGFAAIMAFTVMVGEFLSDKLVNYQENADELTGFSGLEIALGKGLTVFILFAIDIFARRQPRLITARASAQDDLPPMGLYFLYVAVIAASVTLPPLARLLTPLELLIAWAACEAIAGIRNRHTRVSLIFVIAVIAMAKMLKISAQLADIYSVCFFCA